MAMRDRDHRTETMEPYEPSDDAYEWDYDGDPSDHHPPTILWGRVAVLGGAILIAFLLGRLTAPGGVSQDSFDTVKAQRDDAQAQADNLQAQVDDLTAAQDETQDQATPTPNASPTPDTGDNQAAGDEASTTYTVKAGDTLRDVAKAVYCDALAYEGIASANPSDVGPPPNYIIQPGADLVIPDDPDANAC
jgi:LysM domain